MKKLFLILLTLVFVFCGCEDSDFKKSKDMDMYADLDDGFEADDRFDLDDKIDKDDDKAEIEDDSFEDLGETVERITAAYGEPVSSEWVNGPIYKFAANDFWYAFSEYEFSESGYVPKGVCSCIILELDDFIETFDSEIDEDTLVSVSDSKVSKGYDEMDESFYYEITHDEYLITVYTDQNGEVSSDSSARVELRRK